MERDFFTVLDQVLARLHSHGRVTYNTLKLQFNLDDAHLAVLKEELLYTHPEVVDDVGRGLIWADSLSRVAEANSQPAEPTDATGETARAQSDTMPVRAAAPVRPAPELTITHNFRALREQPKGQVGDNKKGAADNTL